ncbi:FAD-binding protein [Shewanella baltica]|uniref:FAD-binding protein n=1 Tax=Shewanella baltica TaxID=62322 RepID=UPI00325EB3E6
MNKLEASRNIRAVIEKSLPVSTSPLAIFTYQCWVKTSAGGRVFHYKTDREDTYFAVDINSLGHIECVINTTLLRVEAISTLGGLNDSQWHLLSICHEYHEINCYVDGEITHTQLNNLSLVADNEFLIENVSLPNHRDTHFDGEIFGITLLNRLLTRTEIVDYYRNPAQQKSITENNLYIYQHQDVYNFRDENVIPLQRQKVLLVIFNDTEYQFIKTTADSNAYNQQLPKIIPPHERRAYIIECDYNTWPNFNYVVNYAASNQADITLNIEVFKSLTAYRSNIKVTVANELERDCLIIQSTEEELSAEVRISENLVITQAKNFVNFINEVRAHIPADNIITAGHYYSEQQFSVSTGKQMIAYQQACQLFNRRLQKKPLAIIKCTSTEEVKIAYKAAIDYNLPISVRSGGNDHEGESTETNTIVLDLLKMDSLTLDPITGIAAIGPGNRFINLTTALAKKGVMIPHGTSGNVALAGFIMGGGSGPWTRKYGMCCESLLQAEIVLGIGETQVVSVANKPELLWALKGGGGLSYGIVTRFFVQTFPLPPCLLKFELEWNCYDKQTQELIEHTPTKDILQRWEAIINADSTGCLIGTNLKINAKHLSAEQHKTPDIDTESIKHNCLMYGFWEGNSASLNHFIQTQFNEFDLVPNEIRIEGMGGLTKAYGENLMANWERESFHHLQADLQGINRSPTPPDLDEPAPHKVTSRLVNQTGLRDGYKPLLESLTSRYVLEGNRQLGLFTYVTLGAIAGDYYRTMGEEQKSRSAFPYKDRQYTIQYQTWWNNALQEKQQLQDSQVFTRINRALDWIDASRNYDIPNTSGAFISFKDKAIPTDVYFDHNYAALKRIKAAYSQDSFNHFRSRKSII